MEWKDRTGSHRIGSRHLAGLILTLALLLSGCNAAGAAQLDMAPTAPVEPILPAPASPIHTPILPTATAAPVPSRTPVPTPDWPNPLPTPTVDPGPFESPLSAPQAMEQQVITTTLAISGMDEIRALLGMTLTDTAPGTAALRLSSAPVISGSRAITPSAEALPAAPTSAADGITRSVQVPILMYHYLSEPPTDADIYRQDLSVSPERFASHLEMMQTEGYSIISLYDLFSHLTMGSPLPERPVVITFDDGYRDNFENALPLLVEYGMTATFFVVTDFIDEERVEYLTWDMVREMLASGMSIESHGRNHVTLAGQSVDYLVWQALGSLETIEAEVGVRPRFVSYPAGQYDQRTLDIFASANYWAGLTTRQGATHSTENPFEMVRVRVRGSTTAEELDRLLKLDW